MPTFYILYSPSADRYYTGATCDDMSERLRRHNSHHKGFTRQASDWQVAYTETYSTKYEAFKRERYVKSVGFSYR